MDYDFNVLFDIYGSYLKAFLPIMYAVFLIVMTRREYNNLGHKINEYLMAEQNGQNEIEKNDIAVNVEEKKYIGGNPVENLGDNVEEKNDIAKDVEKKNDNAVEVEKKKYDIYNFWNYTIEERNWNYTIEERKILYDFWNMTIEKRMMCDTTSQ